MKRDDIIDLSFGIFLIVVVITLLVIVFQVPKDSHKSVNQQPTYTDTPKVRGHLGKDNTCKGGRFMSRKIKAIFELSEDSNLAGVYFRIGNKKAFFDDFTEKEQRKMLNAWAGHWELFHKVFKENKEQ